MRISFVSTVLFFLATFTCTSVALKSNPNSPCAVQCGNVLASTSGSDIACNNGDFSGTAAGITFQSCVTCQLGSTYQDPDTKDTDLQWALYNMRYAISWCLFGYPNNTDVGDTPCITSTACGPLQNSIEFDSLSMAAGTYSYCALLVGVSIPKCSACLAVQTNQYYLNNFMTALNGACQQQPTPGHTVSLQGSVFSTTQVNITSPTTVATGTYNPSKSGLSLGAKIGIAVAGVLLILFIAGFCIIWQGKRRRRRVLLKHQQQTGYSEWVSAQQDRGSVLSIQPPRDPYMSEATSAVSGRGPFYDSPQSQRPLVSNIPWRSGRKEDESPASAIGEKRHLSPYSSQYSSPVSGSDQTQVIQNQWPMDRKGSFGETTSFAKARETRSRSREKKANFGEDFEMQAVAPVLQHPGHGRQSSNASLGLTEDDHRRGDAV